MLRTGEREKERERMRETQRERDTERERDRERETEREKHVTQGYNIVADRWPEASNPLATPQPHTQAS